MGRFFLALLRYPIGDRIESPAEKLERITRERRESYEVRRFRERRQAALKRVPCLWLDASQIVEAGR